MIERTADGRDAPAPPGRHGSAFGVAWGALLVALCVGLAWQMVVCQLAARAIQTGRPDLALAINPRSAAAAGALADRALASGEAGSGGSDAAALADRAIALSPLNPGAVRTLGILAARAGDTAGTDRWMSLGGALGWRDRPTQLWLADRLLASGRYAQALPRIDALLRLGVPWPPLLAVLGRLMAIPAARGPLVETLATMPPWRADLLGDVAGAGAGDLPARILILDLLHATPAPPGRAEVAPLVARLMAIGAPRDARGIWARTIADGTLMTPGGLYDGGLRAIVADGPAFPFEWTVAGDATGSVSAEPEGGVRISLAGDPPQRLIYQQPLLAPGRYRLDAAMGGTPGLGWTIRCTADGANLPLLPVAAGAGRSGVAFVVPPGCETPTIALVVDRMAAGGTLDAQVSDVRLIRG